MKSKYGIVITAFVTAILFISIPGCDLGIFPDQSFRDSVDGVPNFPLIPGGDDATIKVTKNQNGSWFTLELGDVRSNPIIENGVFDGWCALWDAPIESNGKEYHGVKLYLTKNDPKYNRLNYIINKTYDYYAYYPGTTWREIQLAIWDVLDYKDFDISENTMFYGNDGPQYDEYLLKKILEDVNTNGVNYNHQPGHYHAVIVDMSMHITDGSSTQNLIIVTPDLPGADWEFGAIYRSFNTFLGNPMEGVAVQVGSSRSGSSISATEGEKDITFIYTPETGTEHTVFAQMINGNYTATNFTTGNISQCPAGNVSQVRFILESEPGSTVSFYNVKFNDMDADPSSYTSTDGNTEIWGIPGIDGSEEFAITGNLLFTGAGGGDPHGRVKIFVGCNE